MRSFAVAAVALLAVACNTGSKAAPEPAPSAAPVPPATASAALHLGAPIEGSAQKVALADVAKAPDAYVGKTFATTGTRHRGLPAHGLLDGAEGRQRQRRPREDGGAQVLRP